MPEFTIGNYLATRLEQIGIKHYFIVPGDYNLVLLDQLLANKNMAQIGCCNELNASYAAEAYARVNGCGAVVATMNVGSFSALNGVAGAYAGAHLRCSHGAIGAFRDVAEALGCAVAVMPDAKGFFPEDHPQYIGIYWGPVSSPGCEAVMDWADVIVAAGPVFSDYTTAGWTGEPPAEKMINVSARDVRFADAEYTNVALADFLAGLARNVHGNDATLTRFHRIATGPAELAARNGDASAQLTRAELWHQIEQDLDPKSTLLCEGGDSWFNGAFTRLPGGARFEIEMQWGSLGWACPATFGYAMGLEANRRLVSVIGDGSFQLTAQEVANMIRHGQETVIFLVNNRGYVSESAIHDGPYNYFKNWDYAGLIDACNADDGHGLGLTATTGGELADAISKARKHKGGPVLIECQIAHDDCSPKLIAWGARVARANTRPHQTT
jgi:pyruvate decarboxylase/indolepyruvate decarboxylase